MAVAAVSDEGIVEAEAIAVSAVLAEVSAPAEAPADSVDELPQEAKLSKPRQETDKRMRFIGEGL
ncbi:hypothetical protein GCM10011378_21200 [Hymenobacter glacieicola]|uniref:Uncharacterized protein n=1 Tax=Hymenobacter glacieicola TaxID=1562124 RepID=A0ABQ1WVR9_9BACT|nr:hypothetical protein GCM10011378_21200 [Hymenobacter glacieicola]